MLINSYEISASKTIKYLILPGVILIGGLPFFFGLLSIRVWYCAQVSASSVAITPATNTDTNTETATRDKNMLCC